MDGPVFLPVVIIVPTVVGLGIIVITVVIIKKRKTNMSGEHSKDGKITRDSNITSKEKREDFENDRTDYADQGQHPGSPVIKYNMDNVTVQRM